MSNSDTTSHRPGGIDVDLMIGGMTCASCAARIEKRLNKLDGVVASVNYSTERARVSVPDGVTVDDLVAQVEGVGYTARLPEPTTPSPTDGEEPETETDETAPLRRRLVISAALTLPVILLAMVPALQFDAWQWLSLTLAAPVVAWGAWPFHRAAWLNLRHAAATMDTLISIGVLAAFGWSIYALFWGGAGEIGMTHGFSWTAERGAGGSVQLATGRAGAATSVQSGLNNLLA